MLIHRYTTKATTATKRHRFTTSFWAFQYKKQKLAQSKQKEREREKSHDERRPSSTNATTTTDSKSGERNHRRSKPGERHHRRTPPLPYNDAVEHQHCPSSASLQLTPFPVVVLRSIVFWDFSVDLRGMEVEGWQNSSGGTSDSDISVQDTNDEEHYFTSGDIPKLQFRKNISRALWDDEAGMAEVVEKKGGMWTTTGIVHGGKLYCSIEEALFLAERGELSVVDGDDSSIPLKDLYMKVAKANSGCSWESFEVYRHLRSLGYIVRRHGNPWTMKSARNESASAEKTCGGPNLINELLNNMRIDEVRPAFDVYLPNAKFRKSSPGNPSFVLCVTSGHPPSKLQIADLERQCNGTPLKFGHVEHGCVSFFSFNKAELPALP